MFAKSKRFLPLIVVLLAAGASYKFVFASPGPSREPAPRVKGDVYVLPRAFVINTAEGGYAKVGLGLVLAHHSPEPGGETEGAAESPEGLGPLPQEPLVRAIVTDVLTGSPARSLLSRRGRARVARQVTARLRSRTDVLAVDVLFTDVTVQ